MRVWQLQPAHTLSKTTDTVSPCPQGMSRIIGPLGPLYLSELKFCCRIMSSQYCVAIVHCSKKIHNIWKFKDTAHLCAVYRTSKYLHSRRR